MSSTLGLFGEMSVRPSVPPLGICVNGMRIVESDHQRSSKLIEEISFKKCFVCLCKCISVVKSDQITGGERQWRKSTAVNVVCGL